MAPCGSIFCFTRCLGRHWIVKCPHITVSVAFNNLCTLSAPLCERWSGSSIGMLPVTGHHVLEVVVFRSSTCAPSKTGSFIAFQGYAPSICAIAKSCCRLKHPGYGDWVLRSGWWPCKSNLCGYDTHWSRAYLLLREIAWKTMQTTLQFAS